MSRQIWTRTTGLGLVAAFTTLTAPQAAAQQFDATGSTFGTPGREIEVDLTGLATYDTNVSRTNEAGAAARGIEREDVRFSPAVKASVVLPTSAAVLTLTGAAGYDLYARNTQLNRERLDLLAGAGTKLWLCDVGAQLGYARAQNDLADLSIVPGNEEVSSVNVQDTVRVGGTVSCGNAIRPTAYVEYRTLDNSAPARRISNVNTLTYGGGLSYSNAAFGVLTAFIGRSEFDFPERVGIPGALDTFDVTSYGVRLDRRLGGRLQVHGQVTYVNVAGVGPSSDRFDGINWDLSAVVRLGSRAQLSVSAARQIDVSAQFDVRTAQLSVYSAQFDYAFSPLLRGGLTGSIRNRDFDIDTALPNAALLTDDRIVEVGGRLSYSMGRRVTMTLSAGYQERSADLAIYEYDSFRAAIGASLRL